MSKDLNVKAKTEELVKHTFTEHYQKSIKFILPFYPKPFDYHFPLQFPEIVFLSNSNL